MKRFLLCCTALLSMYHLDGMQELKPLVGRYKQQMVAALDEKERQRSLDDLSAYIAEERIEQGRVVIRSSGYGDRSDENKKEIITYRLKTQRSGIDEKGRLISGERSLHFFQ